MTYRENLTLDDVIKNEEIRTYILQTDKVLDVMGYTDHSDAHTKLVAYKASQILSTLGYEDREVELARIAGYTHDIGNFVNRVQHAQTGAIIMHEILTRMHMPPNEIATIVSAIGHHDEKDGMAVSPISAALIIADKSDVRRSRVKNMDLATFDIHDRVNYACTKSILEINKSTRNIDLKLDIDLTLCSVTEYFEIFLSRMIMSTKATEFLGASFHLYMNDTRIL